MKSDFLKSFFLHLFFNTCRIKVNLCPRGPELFIICVYDMKLVHSFEIIFYDVDSSLIVLD